MSTRFWTRAYNIQYGPWTHGAGPATIPLVQAPGTSNVNALVKRMILDVRFSAQVHWAILPRPGADWWTNVDMLVSAGVRGGAGDTYPDSLIDPDPKATITASLRPQLYTTQSFIGNDIECLEWRNAWPLDSGGIRKSPIGGQVPIGCASFTLIDPATNISGGLSGVFWTLQAWLRVLYQDP